MSKVAGIVVVWKLKCPREREIMTPILPGVVPIILDLVSYSLPANIMRLSLFFRIKQWAHTPIVQTSRLDEIGNSEPVDCSCLGISDLEIVPLGVFVCEEVRTQSQLVFIFCPNTQKKKREKINKEKIILFLPTHRKLFLRGEANDVYLGSILNSK